MKYLHGDFYLLFMDGFRKGYACYFKESTKKNCFMSTLVNSAKTIAATTLILVLNSLKYRGRCARHPRATRAGPRLRSMARSPAAHDQFILLFIQFLHPEIHNSIYTFPFYLSTHKRNDNEPRALYSQHRHCCI